MVLYDRVETRAGGKGQARQLAEARAAVAAEGEVGRWRREEGERRRAEGARDAAAELQRQIDELIERQNAAEEQRAEEKALEEERVERWKREEQLAAERFAKKKRSLKYQAKKLATKGEGHSGRGGQVEWRAGVPRQREGRRGRGGLPLNVEVRVSFECSN